MCPACIAAAAVTAAKLASVGGLAAYGIKRLLSAGAPPELVAPTPTQTSGDHHEPTPDRLAR